MAVPSDKPSSDVGVKDSVSPPPELLVAKQAIAVPNKPALKIVPDTVVAETLKTFREDKSDETFVEVDAKSQSQAKSKSKAKAKMKFFFSSFFSGSSFFDSCDSSRRRRDDENPRRGDPDCSGTDCQRGLSRRRRSNDCQSVSVDSCFPASTLVETESRGAVEMKEVLLGERIKTAEGFSEVLFFAMRNPIAHAQCWEISTDTHSLVLTHSHGLFKEDGSVVQVMHVSVGDSILSAGVVTGTERVKCTGLVAPVTRAGTIVVNGVITSDYGPMGQMLGQRTVHTLAMPIRAMQWAFPQWSFWHSNGNDGRHPIMVLGQSLLSMVNM
jgi:hypothetical protein